MGEDVKILGKARNAWMAAMMLAVGIFIGVAISNFPPPGTDSLQDEASPGPSVGEDSISSQTASAANGAAQEVVDDASASFDAGMDALYASRSDYAPADPELERGSRQAVELNEMICRETGQNCEFAKLARRHHIERFGRF